MAIYHLLFYFLLSLPFPLNNTLVNGARALQKHHISTQMEPTACKEGPASELQAIPISHKYGPCSPLGQEKLPPSYREEAIVQDQSRVSFLNSLKQQRRHDSSVYGDGVKLPLTSPSPLGDDFFATVSFGTPKRDFNLLFDTGSDVTWIPCQPYSAPEDPGHHIFDPSASSTFSNATCIDSKSCVFSVLYQDRSATYGYYANDTLTIPPNDVLPGFVFGCAQKIVGNFGEGDGVLGLGQGIFSLAVQTSSTFLGVFCYCLPATGSSKGFLVFGVQAYQDCHPDNDKLIPVTVNPNQNGRTNYLVHLKGLTFAGQRVDFSSNVSLPTTVDTIIDSGTVISRLPPPVYSKLQDIFGGIMARYPSAPRSGILDTCYNLEGYGDDWTPPSVVLHFEGNVDIELDPSAATLRDNDSSSHVCLAFAANAKLDELTIIGNQQHRLMKILYDINGGKLSLSGGGCS